jgi:tetratricopeptide (TPR) repeat protein
MAKPQPVATDTETPVLPPQQRFEEALISLLGHLRRLAIPILVAFVAALIVGTLVIKQQASRRSQRAQAFVALSQARQISTAGEEAEAEAKAKARQAALEAVVKDYPTTPAALQAEFDLAALLFERMKYDEAAAAFAAFAQQHPTSQPLTAHAQLGQINALLNQRKYQEAHDLLTAFVSQAATQAPELVPLARYRTALCAFALGRADEGNKILTELLADPSAAYLRETVQRLRTRLDVLPADAMSALAAPLAESATPTAP